MDTGVLILILLFGLGAWAQTSGAHTECSPTEEHRVDVVILLDGFNHISPDDFSRVRDFLKTLVSMLGPVGPDLVRVGLVKNSRDPEVEFYQDTFHDLPSVVGAVSRMSQSPPLPGGSLINALMFTSRHLFRTNRGHRGNVPDSLILVTDRNLAADDTKSMQQSLHQLWSLAVVKAFVVGVKVTDKLEVVVEDLNSVEVFTVEDYNSMSSIVQELTQSMCRWLKERLGQAQPLSLRFTDVQPRRARASWEYNSRWVRSFELNLLPDRPGLIESISAQGHKRSREIPHLLPNASYTVTIIARESTGQRNNEIQVLTTPQDGVRLSRGLGRCSGSVEVLMNQSWSSVCARDFGLTEAAVVCDELDCGAVSELHQGALFTESPALGWSFHCDGKETSLKECESSATRCSTAANLTCSDTALRMRGYSCRGALHLRYKDMWRPVTTVELDLDFGSALCEQMGCGSAHSVFYYYGQSKLLWWLKPGCVKQRSGLTNCLDLDSRVNVTKGGLFLSCSEFYPVVRTTVSSDGMSVSSEAVSISSEGVSVSSESLFVSSEGMSVSSDGVSVSSDGVSVSSEGMSVSSEWASVSSEWVSVSSDGVSVSSEEASQSRVQRVLVMLGANFSVSCSLYKPYVPGWFHLLSPTGNYSLPDVNHSAQFQDFSPAHIGNYTCVYCDSVNFINASFKSTTLYITPGAPDSLLLIRAAIFVLTLLLWTVAMFLYYKGCRAQKKPIRRARHTPPSEDENNMVQMIIL